MIDDDMYERYMVVEGPCEANYKRVVLQFFKNWEDARTFVSNHAIKSTKFKVVRVTSQSTITFETMNIGFEPKVIGICKVEDVNVQ
jgi:hypothetical protein